MSSAPIAPIALFALIIPIAPIRILTVKKFVIYTENGAEARCIVTPKTHAHDADDLGTFQQRRTPDRIRIS